MQRHLLARNPSARSRSLDRGGHRAPCSGDARRGDVGRTGAWFWASVAACATLLAASPATAQVIPSGNSWVALRCGLRPMTDPLRDQKNANDERDIVGDTTAPAGYRAADKSFLYLRIRLDKEVINGKDLRPFAWGVEFDTDRKLSTYEVLALVDGKTDKILLYKNTQTTLPNDPNDPADTPPVKTYDFSSNGSAAKATGSAFGGNADGFLSFALPWKDIEPLGLKPTTPLVVWVGTSSNSNSLNGDFACHDGSTGSATLSAIASDRTVLDPTVDSDGDGFTDQVEINRGSNPNDKNSVPGGGTGGGGDGGSGTGGGDGGTGPSGVVRMEGGGGCSAGSSDPRDAAPFGIALVALFLIADRRRRRGPAR